MPGNPQFLHLQRVAILNDVQIQAGKLRRRLEVAGFGDLFIDLWRLAEFVAKVFLCLAFLNGLALCYVNTFWHIRYFEHPTDGLTYVTDADVPQLNEFRKRTLTSVCQPLSTQLEAIKAVRRQTQNGTVCPPTLERDLEHIRGRLSEIKTEARLRRIPKQYEGRYEWALLAIQDAEYSINELEDSFEQKTKAARKKLYQDSIKKWRSATKKCEGTAGYFSQNDWRPEPKEPKWRPAL